MQETQVQSLGGEDPLEKEMATNTSILAWRISMDRGAWHATVHGVTKSGTQMCMHVPQQLGFNFFISKMEIFMSLGFPGVSVVKNSPANAGDMVLIPESGRSPGGGHGNPLQCLCLENYHGQRSLAGYSP